MRSFPFFRAALRSALCGTMAWALGAGGVVAQETVVRQAVLRFLDADVPEEKEVALQAILAMAPEFSEVFESLVAGRTYAADVPVGQIQGVHQARDGTRFPYFIQVPESYDARRRYPVRVFLHGGVSRAAWEPNEIWWSQPSRLRSEEYIGVFPAAWREQRWWTSSQLENLRAVLGSVQRTYNMDENRVALIGVSDGGTGVYWVAFRDTTPWASFLPFIGHPAVLQNPSIGVSAPVYRANLINKPFYVVNGEDDRLYPTRAVDPFIADFKAAGVDITYRPLKGYGHETAWWPDEAQRIDAFIAEHPRLPHPARIVWQTETTESAARAHWVRIDEIGYTASDERFGNEGLWVPQTPGSRIEVDRVGNRIEVRSEGVAAATFLISPDAFDLAQPITVVWNGSTVFDARVVPAIETLLRWAARDDDRTLLYAAELNLKAPLLGGSDLRRR